MHTRTPSGRQGRLGIDVCAWVFALASLITAVNAGAQEIEPRSYSNIPIGMNFLVAVYAHAQGGVSMDPSVPLENADLSANSLILGYARSFEFFGQSAKFDVIVPYARTAGSADYLGDNRYRAMSSFTDSRFRVSVNFHGAPAVSLKEFASYKQDLILGASVQVMAPTGKYDADRLLNNGTNRWAVKPEFGASKAWGPWILEVALAGTYFFDNDDFFGGKHRSQDPLYALQGHLIHSFPSGIWVALDGTYFTGGRTTVDGVRSADMQRNTRGGVTVAVPINRQHSLKFAASSGFSARTGNNYDLYAVGWQYRWGGGM